jgi:predicted ATPase/DNA-binding winged helix-turn-helix (wHTH) protein
VRTERLAFEEFRLDPANALLWRGDDRVALAPKPFEVLCHLVDRPGELVTKDELLDAVWSNLHVSESSLSVAISALRSALGDDPNSPRYIETVTRRGYRFVAPVAVISPPQVERPPDRKASAPSFAVAARPLWRVGRTGQIEALERLLQQTLGGNRQVVFIIGEAGIGKTTLVEMVMERLSRGGVGVLLGRCIEHFGMDEAFLPLIEALQGRCREADGPLLLMKLREHAPTWLAQMPSFLDARDRASLQNEIFGTTRERMLREFCELVEDLSSDRPWILVIEDLHWSDYATVDALSLFARRQQKASVLVLATYRPGDVMIGGHPIRFVHQELQIHGRSTQLALDRLSLTEVEQYLALRFADAEIAQALAERVFRRTGGQPLFVVSLVDYFVAEHKILEVDGRWRLTPSGIGSKEDIPRDLREMIALQIDRLTVEDQRLLETASAAGAEFSAAVVAAALDRGIPEVEQACESLARKGQVIAPSGLAEWQDGTVAGLYAFLHALYQELLYQRLAPGQRIQQHRRLGERLEVGYGARTAEIASVLALHFEEGRDFAKAVRYLGEAAENAAKRFSNREAAIYLTRALGLVNHLTRRDQIVRIKLLQQRAWVRRSAGDFAGSLEDLNEMISCAAENQQLRSEVSGLLDLSRFSLYADRRQCLEIADRALTKSLPLDDVVLKALVEGNRANLNLYLKAWRDEDANLCRQAVKMTAEARDPSILIRRCSVESILNYMNSNYLDCCVATKRGQELAQAIGDEYLFVLFNLLESFALLHLGEWHKLQQNAAAALAMTERNANEPASVLCHLTIAWLHAEALDFENARKRCEKTLDSNAEANPFVFFLGRNLLAKAYLGLHDYPSALVQFNDIIHRIEIDGIDMDRTIVPHFYHNFCEYWLEVGDLTRAREQATRLYNVAARPPERTYLALAHRLLAKIAMTEGSLEEARVQLSRAISVVDNVNLPLAAWRVYATAANLYELIGEESEAAYFRSRSGKAICTLAKTLDQNDLLRSSLLAGFAAENRAAGPIVALRALDAP